MKSKWAAVTVFFTVVACASAPKINYYTVDMTPSGKARSNLKVERLVTTEALSRSQILIQSTATRVEYYATDCWAGSLGELVQQKLTAEFGELSGDSRGFVLSGTITAFGQVDEPGGAKARVELLARVRDAAAKRFQAPVLEKTYRATRSLGKAGPDDVVSGLSRCLEEIAGQIAHDLDTL